MRVSFLKSLKGKILFLYVFGIFFMSLFLAVSYSTFRSVFEVLLKSEQGALLVEKVLEMRRYEKNYLLYHHPDDLKIVKQYLQESKEVVENQREFFSRLIGRENLKNFELNLRSYAELLEVLERQTQPPPSSFFEKLRMKGKLLTEEAEAINQSRERLILNSLRELKNWLYLLLALFVILVFFYGYYLYISLTRPLKKLENYIFQIIQGKFCAVPPDFEDREMQLLVEALNKMLAELDRRKEYLLQTERLATFGTLLFSLAHELNNPLNNIYTSCQVLREEIEGEQAFQREILLEMEKEIERTQKIIRSILDYSKPGEKESIRLKDLIEETLYLIKGKIPSQIEIRLEIPEEFSLLADPQQMKQVFINLFKNAFEAMENKEGVITLKALEEGDKTLILFSDTGPGIPAKVLPHIFDPFFTTKEKKGYGLGLFIVYNLIQNNQGELEVESEVGKGTTFIIKLPKGERERDGKREAEDSRD